MPNKMILETRIEHLQSQLLELEKDRDHWKANHDTQVKAARALKERDDIPVERVMYYDEFIRLAKENIELAASNALLTKTQKYRHYKGGIYDLVCFSKLESDREIEMVTYRAFDGTIWTRPKSVFFELVVHDNVTQPRFKEI